MELLEDLVKERFGRAAVRTLCEKPGLFEPGRLYRRVDISEKLRAEFVNLGGDSSTTKEDVAVALKTWLHGPDCPFRKEARGRYRFRGSDGEPDLRLRVEHRSDSSSEAPPLAPELEIGAGPCEVYAWYLPEYAHGSERWPIKIGRTGADGLGRKLRDFQEHLPEKPRYLLRLGCADDGEARKRESLLHAWFECRGQKLGDPPGRQWFRTNPGEITEAIRNVIVAPPSPGDVGASDIGELVALLFEDVAAADWARLPGDMTDRLDDYLYGDEGR